MINRSGDLAVMLKIKCPISDMRRDRQAIKMYLLKETLNGNSDGTDIETQAVEKPYNPN